MPCDLRFFEILKHPNFGCVSAINNIFSTILGEVTCGCLYEECDEFLSPAKSLAWKRFL